jgi:hypothetical protein
MSYVGMLPKVQMLILITISPPFANILLSVRAGLLKRNFKYETKSKIQMEWRGSEG